VKPHPPHETLEGCSKKGGARAALWQGVLLSVFSLGALSVFLSLFSFFLLFFLLVQRRCGAAVRRRAFCFHVPRGAGLGRLLLLRGRRRGRHRLGDVDPGGRFKGRAAPARCPSCPCCPRRGWRGRDVSNWDARRGGVVAGGGGKSGGRGEKHGPESRQQNAEHNGMRRVLKTAFELCRVGPARAPRIAGQTAPRAGERRERRERTCGGP
jgi:uncharacterized membrane protein YgcG